MNSLQRPTLHFSRTVFLVLGAAIFLPWAALILVLVRERPSPPPAAARLASDLLPPGAIAAKPGPWGEIFYTRVLIEPPEFLLPPPGAKTAPPIWHFRETSAEELRTWFASLPLTPEQLAEITSSASWEINADLIRIRRSDALAASLSPEARARLYTRLADFAENTEQANPFRFRADAAEEWFRDSGLPAATIERVKKLLYRRGTSLIFSDLSLVLPHVPSQAERTQLIKTLSRKSTLMVQLRLPPDADVDALENYWGRGQRSRDLKPLLRSHVHKDNATSIDIIHLLPRGPRQLLYTYPLPNEKGGSTFLDCHWTTLNFFNAQPDSRYENIEAVQQAYLNDYFVLTGKPTFGDVIILTRGENVVHSCVYIADDIVYTKNGAQPNAPWILMTLSDVIAFYPSDEPLDVQFFRSKQIATSP